jgi:hypothetical protein
MVKGWLDSEANVQERVYDVVWGNADERESGKDAKLPAVGSGVDINNGAWTSTTGDPEPVTVWTAPDSCAEQGAFCCARVLEVATPHWTAYDAKRFVVKREPGPRITLQERACTPPIAYTAVKPSRGDGCHEESNV